MARDLVRHLGLPDDFDDEFLFKPSGGRELCVKQHQMYKFYTKCDLKQEMVSSNVFSLILVLMAKKIWHAIITEIWRFRLPFRLGSIYIVDRINKGHKYKDWVSSIDKGELVKRYNVHTKGKRFAIKWNKDTFGPKHHLLYDFKPSRGQSEFGYYVGRRGLARWIKKLAADPTQKDFSAHLY